MTQKSLVYLLVLMLLYSCSTEEAWNDTVVQVDRSSVKIAFGSCAQSYDTLEIFDAINEEQPDLWIWLGDIVYGDTHDMTVLKAKYDRQKDKPQYQELLVKTPVIGVWDDHDYGINDGGKYYSKKKESKELLLDYLDVKNNDPIRKRAGAYSSYHIEAGDKLIKVLLLDTRYFRDTLEIDTISTARYLANNQGDVLGSAQWSWLDNELKDSRADFHIIGSSIQLIAEEQGYEKWANFPSARERFFKLLEESGSVPTIVISGDRHMAELSKIELENLDYPLFDFTASGLTHTWGMYWPEPNQYRVDSLIISKNFGILNISFTNGGSIVDLEVKDEKGTLLLTRSIEY